MPVFVRASAGTLTAVQMTNEGGRVIAGTMTPDHRMWRPAVRRQAALVTRYTS